MRALAILLFLPLLSSCALLQAPGRLIQSAGRTFGLTGDNAQTPNAPEFDPSAQVALKATEQIDE